MEAKAIDFSVAENGVASLRFVQPERGNPIDQAWCNELTEYANECGDDPAVRAVLISAEGRFFSVGGDLQSLGASQEGLKRFIKNGTVGLHAGVSRLARMNAPTVIAIHAMCAGGMVSVAAACDFAIAARSAKFYAAYPAIGLTVDGGGSYFLPRRVGSRRAAAFYLRQETWSAEQALEYGLISDVVDDDELMPAAEAMAAQLAAGPTLAFGDLKNLLLSSSDQSLEGQLELEARSMSRMAWTEDTWNAISAVKNKQRATFNGR